MSIKALLEDDAVAEALKALECGDTNALADLIESSHDFAPSDIDALRKIHPGRVNPILDKKARAKIRYDSLRDMGTSAKAAFGQVVAEFDMIESTLQNVIDSKDKRVVERVREIRRNSPY